MTDTTKPKTAGEWGRDRINFDPVGAIYDVLARIDALEEQLDKLSANYRALSDYVRPGS